MFGFFDHKHPPDIRRVGTQSAQACAAIHARSFPHPWPAADFESLLAARDVIAEAAMAAGRRGKYWGKPPALAGFVLSRRVLDEAEILTIAVAPEFRRRGIGSALLSVHLATLAAQGAKALFLEVEAGNHAALALYAGFDFYEVGARKAYYRKADGSAAAALVLRRDFV